SATASSGLAVTFSANGACTVSGSTAHITGAGSCTITASQAGDSNYSAVSTSVLLNIGKATPVITWNNPADITYGTALGGTQLNATASTAGSFTYTPSTGTVLNVGNGQTLHVDFTPTDTANYNTASKDVMINVVAPATSSGSGGTSPDRDATSPGSGTASPGSGTTPTPPADSSQTMPTITWNITPA